MQETDWLTRVLMLTLAWCGAAILLTLPFVALYFITSLEPFGQLSDAAKFATCCVAMMLPPPLMFLSLLPAGGKRFCRKAGPWILIFYAFILLINFLYYSTAVFMEIEDGSELLFFSNYLMGLFFSLWLIGCLLDLRRPPHGFCANCGYNLKGNVSGVCSECGWKFRAGKKIRAIPPPAGAGSASPRAVAPAPPPDKSGGG